jgi:gluconate 2-dehydrogenase gamma chain
MPLSRRTLLQAAGIVALPRAATAATAATPDAAWTARAHERIAHSSAHSSARALADDERVVLSAVADALLPRTETPGALDVGVPAFVELLIGEWASDDDRRLMRDGLRDLEAHAVATQGRGWATLDAAQREAEIAWGERSDPEPRRGQRAFRRLKGWITHGWLTSERVQKDVLRVNIVPGAYDGCAPRQPVGGRD